MNNKDFINIKVLLGLALFSLLVLCFPVCVNAEEIIDSDDFMESETDLSQNERLNALEVRLEEMGYTINDIEMSIESIFEEFEQLEEQRLSICQQLELLIIGISQLCDDNISFSEKYDAAVVESSSMQSEMNDSLARMEAVMNDLNDNTVSGNTLITSFSDSIKTDMQNISETSINEFNVTLLRTNTLLAYLLVLLLIILVLIIVFAICAVVQNIIKKSIF